MLNCCETNDRKKFEAYLLSRSLTLAKLFYPERNYYVNQKKEGQNEVKTNSLQII